MEGTTKDFFSEGNEAFVEENYEEAINLYTNAIKLTPTANIYTSRAHAYIKIEKFDDAIKDCSEAIQLSPEYSLAFLRNGIAHFNMKLYEEANEWFEKGQAIQASNQFETWIKKCTPKLKDIKKKPTDQTTTLPAAPTTQSTPDVIPMPSPKIRHDWYQTEGHVIITIMVKNVKAEEFTYDVNEKSLSVSIKLASGSDYSLELDLLHAIIANETKVKILGTKVEIKLKKCEGFRWTALEGEYDPTIKQISTDPSASNVKKYPSSSHHGKDWDKLVTEIKAEEKNEKPEGDAALNSLFQQIYGDGSDEVKMAMNKSFSESGGTVLSTNWNEISDKKTEVKPPDGMEYKKWEQ